jgi:hypothetical protein
MNKDMQKLFSRLFVARGLIYLIAGAFEAEFVSGQAMYVDGGQTVA